MRVVGLDSPVASQLEVSAGPFPSCDWNESLHKAAECCNHWMSGQAKVAPLLLTVFHLTPGSAGYGTHLEARWEVLTAGRTPDFCLFPKAVSKKRLMKPYPEYCIQVLLDHSSRCGFTPHLLRTGVQNRFSGTENKHLNHWSSDWKPPASHFS